MPDLDATAMQIRGFLEKGARQADAARQEFDKEIHDFRTEREDLHEDMRLLHADRVNPRSIEGMVEDSIASRLRAINADMLGVVSTLALIRDVQQIRRLVLLSSTHHVVRNRMNYTRQYPLNTQHL